MMTEYDTAADDYRAFLDRKVAVHEAKAEAALQDEAVANRLADREERARQLTHEAGRLYHSLLQEHKERMTTGDYPNERMERLLWLAGRRFNRRFDHEAELRGW